MNTLPIDSTKPRLQRGAASVAIAMLIIFILVAAVLGVQSISGTSAVDAVKNDEQVTALFLAESGLERGQGMLKPPFTNTTCTNTDIAVGAALPLGSGSFSSSAISCDNSSPPVCGGSGSGATCSNGNCRTCTITVTGTVNGSSRTISRTFKLSSNTGGTFCNTVTQSALGNLDGCTNSTAIPGPPIIATWKSSVTNTSGKSAIALFHMAANRQSNWSAATCQPSACKIVWTVAAQNGTNSVGGQGNAIELEATGPKAAAEIYQSLNLNRNVVENGALFPGDFVARVGGYWNDDDGGGGDETVGKLGDVTGQTNNGTANNSTTSPCTVTPGNVLGPGGKQVAPTCTSWCDGADTLVLGIAANAITSSDIFTSVLFNTAGTNPQNIPLTLVSDRYPLPGTVGAPEDVFSEIRYAHNPVFSAKGVNSGASFTGYVGTLFEGYIANSAKTLNVTAAPTGVIFSVGAVISGMDAGTTITSVTGGGACNDTPTSYPCTLSVDSPIGPGGKQTNSYGSASVPADMTISSSILTVTSTPTPTGQAIGSGDKIFVAGLLKGTISSGASGTVPPMTYTLSAPASIAPSVFQTDGTALSSTTPPHTLPFKDAMSYELRLAVKSGTGKLCSPSTTPACSSGTTVPLPVSPATLYLEGTQLSARPAIPLSNAEICGGTCAFFDHGAATTQFSVTRSSTNIDYWAAGFTCLSGVTMTPTETTSGPQTATGTTWQEVVR